MYNWFECKVKYEKDLGEGKTKKVIEPYLVDALSFTEAEHRIISEIQPFMSGEFQVSDIKRVNIAELFETKKVQISGINASWLLLLWMKKAALKNALPNL